MILRHILPGIHLHPHGAELALTVGLFIVLWALVTIVRRIRS